MTDTKWTPGPWTLNDVAVKGGPDGELVADVFTFARDNEENVANARLIAAVPDLYEALRLIVAYDDGKPFIDYDYAIERARAALAAARGEK